MQSYNDFYFSYIESEEYVFNGAGGFKLWLETQFLIIVLKVQLVVNS